MSRLSLRGGLMKGLVADDSKVTRRVLRDLLRDLAPEIEVDAAENGREVVAMHKARGYDIIFLDVTMPEMTGIEALKQIRTHDPSVLVVILSALEDDETLGDAQTFGASAFLAKPFSSLHVQAALQLLTGRPPAAHVLLIDDSRAQRAILRQALGALEEASNLACVLDEAEDGPEGLRKALGGGHDIVFLDVNMPSLNGVDVLREIKKAHGRAKVVMLSGEVDDAFAARMRTLGADACLPKPVSVPDVLTCIVEMLDPRRIPQRPSAKPEA